MRRSMKNYINEVLTILLVLVGCLANAQTHKPTIVFQIDNEIIGNDSFVVDIKQTSPTKSKLVLKTPQKTIKVKIPNDLIYNTDSIEIKTFHSVEAKVVNLIDVYVCFDRPVYHCFQCHDSYHRITTIYLYQSCEQLDY